MRYCNIIYIFFLSFYNKIKYDYTKNVLISYLLTGDLKYINYYIL